MRASCVMFVVVVAAGINAAGGEWPQILGPNRNGAAMEEALADSWPKGGPKSVWQREVGSGFAGVAVASGKCVLFHRLNDSERVEAMDAATGDVLWKLDFPATYSPSYTRDDGPRCVPVIHRGRVYLSGAAGNLYCVDLEKGTKLWSRNPFKDYNSGRPWRGEPPDGYFGLGSTPLVEGDRLIVNVGGDEKKAGVVAFELDTGKTAWAATSERASYSSPVATTVDGVRHVFVISRLNCVSLDPKDGTVRAEIPFGKRGPTVNGACPVVVGDHLFLTSSYGVGAVFAKVGKSSLTAEWESDDVLSSQYATPIEHEGALYGLHGRQDIGIAELRCIDPVTQKIHWSKENFGYGSPIKADGKLIVLTTKGGLVLVSLTKEGYRELARTNLLNSTTQALPALADGRLYARDEGTLKCVDLR